MDVEVILSRSWEFVLTYGPKLVGAIIVLIVGLYIIKLIVRSVSKMMQKSKLDDSLVPFVKTLLDLGLKAMLFISVLTMVGIEMTSFIALLGAAGLAVGMALSGTLQNFAGGVMILVFKPFKVGDYIDAQGHSGSVKEIQIFNTILTTPDNKTIIIPNGGLSTSSMTNFSAEELRRVDFSFGFAYGEDYEKVKALLLGIINADDRIIKEDKVPFIGLGALADSSVNVTVRVWAKASDYWGIHFAMNETVYSEFNKAGIGIPFPQLDVHIQKD